MFRRILLLLLCCTLLCTVFATADEAVNLLDNPSFEELDSNGLPSGWFTDAYVKREGVSQFSVIDDAKSGNNAVMVENFDLNDARFAQTVQVAPNAMYRLSGWIKTSVMSETGHGANLSIEGVHARSDSFRVTNGAWEYVETYGMTSDEQTEVTIFARVGGYSGESQGTAYFDDLSLVRVDSLPSGVFAEAWYTISAPQVVSPVEQSSAESSPAWPWLAVIAAIYAACAFMVMRHLQLDRTEIARMEHAERTRCSMPVFVLIGFIIALLARIIVALQVDGYQVDVNCFTAWGNTMSSVGPSLFYQSNWCDYTPGYIYVMGLNGLLSKLLDNTVSAAFVHKMLPVACDLIAAWLIYHLAIDNGYTRKQAGYLALLFAFHPAPFINSAAWCQIDSVLCLGLMLVAYFSIHRKWAIVLPLYVLCILVKPQALMLGFLGLAALIMEWYKQPERREHYLKELGIGIAASLVITLSVVLPFSPNQESPWWLFKLYGDTLASYPYATVNTTNLYYLFGANWDGIANSASSGVIIFFILFSLCCCGYFIIRQHKKRPLWWLESAIMACYASVYLFLLLIGCNWTIVGIVAMSMAFMLVLPMFIRSSQMKNLPLCGAVIFLLLYVFGIKMHERYLFPALFLLGMAYALRRDKRLLWLLIGAGCVLFINEGIVLDNSLRLGSSMGHLNQDTVVLAKLLSLVNIVLTLLSVWCCHSICVEDSPLRLTVELPESKLPVETYNGNPCTPQNFKVNAKIGLRRKDILLMLVVTLVYSIVTLTTLGSTKAPQTPWKSSAKDEFVYIDLGKRYDNFSMLYFCQVSYNNFAVAVSDDAVTWSEEYPAQMAEGQCFQWKYLKPSYTANGEATFVDASTFEDVQKLSGRYVRIDSKQVGLIINEVLFKDEQGNIIDDVSILRRENGYASSPLYTSPAKLLDEQDTLDGEPSWWNSTYFDEIYHARTAFEHLNKTNAYEWTHPPLGKVIMSCFIGLFGMTPFGWRFAGALCGILMLPAMYLLVKQLTKRTDLAFYGMMLMTLDCMHFTQTRLATIDSYPVLFIILSYFFMLRFMQRDIILEDARKLLPDLAFSGFFMGCGFASKWIGAYAGIGLAVLFFWTCVRHLRMKIDASVLLRTSESLTDTERTALSERAKSTVKRVIVLCLWCLLFFVAVPLTIYLLSYVVHFGDREFTDISHFLKTVYNTNFGKYNSMLSYHSTPGLGMDHYYYSPWYEWPLMIKPMYYASAAFKPDGMTYAIFCFGNPWVWCVGLAGVAYTVYYWLSGHRYRIAGREGNWQLLRNSWDVCPAFVLIGLLAQFLPWVLVPRGTYIYHYFASVPFLILGTVLLMQQITICSPSLRKRLLIGHLALCLIWFVLLFPYASGVIAPNWWMDFIRDYPYVSLLPDYWKSDFLVDLNTFLEKIPIFPHVYHH